MHSYLDITDLPLTDIGINEQNLEQPTQFVSSAFVRTDLWQSWIEVAATRAVTFFTPVQPRV